MQDSHSETDQEASLLTKKERRGIIQYRFLKKGKEKVDNKTFFNRNYGTKDSRKVKVTTQEIRAAVLTETRIAQVGRTENAIKSGERLQHCK